MLVCQAILLDPTVPSAQFRVLSLVVSSLVIFSGCVLLGLRILRVCVMNRHENGNVIGMDAQGNDHPR